MCGRFTMTLPLGTMTQLFDAVPNNDLPSVPDFNVCPTQQIHAIVPGDKRRLVSMRWGFIPRWYASPTERPLLINARSETIAQKSAFREACRMRRCLIPMSGFYEWSKTLDEKR
ncbi:MAG: SOS response-associated peptidase [Planktomarina sp.]|nr:SOS response-associated peptidase [Planktomarina sp.]